MGGPLRGSRRPRTAMTSPTTDHLTQDEIDDAVGFRLEEDRISHLVGCQGCQNTVEWQRMARLGTLWDDERDWAAASLQALAIRAKSRGNGLVYAVVHHGVRSRLVRMRFEPPVIVKINTKG